MNESLPLALKCVLKNFCIIFQNSLPREERRNATKLYHPVSIRELQESYPYLNWLDYINALLPSHLQVNESEILSNTEPKFFEQLGEILSSTSKRTMANYFLWRIIYEASGKMTKQLRQPKFQFFKTVYGLQAEPPRWKECVQFILDR